VSAVAFLVATILFFVAAIGENDPNLIPWGLGFLATGHLLGGTFAFPWDRRP
jgi:hypothetical protein